MPGASPRIDAHQHFWKYSRAEYGWIEPSMSRIARDFEGDALKPELSARGVTGCVAVQARTAESENAYLLDLAERHPFILGVVGWLDLASPELSQRLGRLKESAGRRLVGLREVLQGEPDEKCLNPRFIESLRLLGERGYTYDILVYSRQLDTVSRLLQATRPDQPLVLDHLGKPDIRGGEFAPWDRSIRALARDHPNLHCKLSGMVTEADRDWTVETFRPYFDTLIEAFGPSRLMFGSDWPVCLLNATDYGAVHDLAQSLVRSLAPGESDAVFGGTAERFYGLPPAPSPAA